MQEHLRQVHVHSAGLRRLLKPPEHRMTLQHYSTSRSSGLFLANRRFQWDKLKGAKARCALRAERKKEVFSQPPEG